MDKKAANAKFSYLLRFQSQPNVQRRKPKTESSILSSPSFIERIQMNSAKNRYHSLIEKARICNPPPHRKQLINKQKINKVFIESQFDGPGWHMLEKRKSFQSVPKKKQKKCDPHHHHYKSTAENFRKKSCVLESAKSGSGYRRKFSQNIQEKTSYGLENINVSLEKCLRKKIGEAGLFLSTSSNSFFGTSFYSSNRIKTEGHKADNPQEDKNIKLITIKSELDSKIVQIRPRCLPNKSRQERKKNYRKFSTNNDDQFKFGRSKTEELDLNNLCGWEEDRNHYQNFDDQFF